MLPKTKCLIVIVQDTSERQPILSLLKITVSPLDHPHSKYANCAKLLAVLTTCRLNWANVFLLFFVDYEKLYFNVSIVTEDLGLN